MKTIEYRQAFTVQPLSEDTYQLKILRSDPDLDLSPLEFYLDTQQLILLIDACRSALT